MVERGPEQGLIVDAVIRVFTLFERFLNQFLVEFVGMREVVESRVALTQIRLAPDRDMIGVC